MPTYLLHGFRWPRPLVRVHIILQNLDDAAAEWLVAPQTTLALLQNFHYLYPECMLHLRGLRFIEQYDPNDTGPSAASQPYAYVADIVHEVKLGVCIDDVTTKGIATEQWGAALELRDRLAPEEKVGWYVVVCGDEERWAPPTIGQLEAGARSGSLARSSEYSDSEPKPQSPPEEPEPRGLRKLFGSRASRKNRKRCVYNCFGGYVLHVLTQPSTSRPPVPDFKRSQSESPNASRANLPSRPAQSPGGVSNGEPMRNGNGMTNGHGVANGHGQANGHNHINGQSRANGHGMPTGYGVPNGHGLPNGHQLSSDQRSVPGSGSNSSSGGGSSISPPVTLHEQKMLGGAQFQSADFGPQKSATVQHRRRTLSNRLQAGMSAPPVLAEEQVATRWNPNGVEAPFEHRPARRTSNVPAFSNSPRAASPEFRRAHSPVSIIRSPLRTGAMSPVSTLRNESITRSQSPLSHEITSAGLARNQSPARGVGNIAWNGNAWAQQQHATQEAQHRQNSLAALQGAAAPPQVPAAAAPAASPLKTQAQKLKHRLSLQTQIPAPPPVPEEDEVMEVITMSPAVRTPVASSRKSRSSLALSALPGASSSQVNLSGMNLTRAAHKPYFGQAIDSSDLVASGIENAFDRL
ncbi:hypothetical protein LTR91_001108 [Friedmanniomyces endolithicus]|uniref:Uncharacterized protein n=1 Tax=Friedmanniomyces endolithicus TaxID=329885 RepID=A0AAN6FJ13_9PEZI|nr:hypothetical protein LTS09_011777 [Friedmanniomyces endolithicus]KAK0268836.1 hypothetical protein LTR35_015258 [Friedmanniomyces endolithicus]KAK0318059.1 hypothetical protein LTR82_011049 [Friedmanniomyces endolithicus]KAK0922946.1 hypothetical protein LTR57_007243 [Friedmanniomyces endolithicus]KAK1011395.1 hypothetical protein LTS01_001251 [Friedmanniomyces endolithicus]